MEYPCHVSTAVVLEAHSPNHHINVEKTMDIIVTDRWGNEITNPDKTILDKTLDDVFLDNALPEVSITDVEFRGNSGNSGDTILNCPRSSATIVGGAE